MLVDNWRRWPRLLQRSAAGLMAVHLLALLYLLLAGSPQPISPAKSLFAPVSVEQALLASRPELSSLILFFAPFLRSNECRRTMPWSTISKTQRRRTSCDEVVEGIDGVAYWEYLAPGKWRA